MSKNITGDAIPTDLTDWARIAKMKDEDIVYDEDTPYDPNNADAVNAFWDGAVHKAGRGKQKAPTKVPTTVRLSPEVLEYFRASGKGWQTRLDTVLREYVATH